MATSKRVTYYYKQASMSRHKHFLGGGGGDGGAHEAGLNPRAPSLLFSVVVLEVV